MAAGAQEYADSGWENPLLREGFQALQKVFGGAGGQYGREGEIYDALAKSALEGYSPEQLQVAREAARSWITNQLNSAIRGSLGNAGNLGVFGRDITRGLLAPGANGMNALSSTTNALTNLERDLFLNNIARKDALSEKAFGMGDTIRKRQFGEQLDASGNLMQGANLINENRMKAFENMVNSQLNLGNQILNIQNTNNDNLNAYELGKVGAFTGGMGFADSAKTNAEVLKLQRSALNSTNNVGRSGGSSAPTNFATSAREWNQPSGPTNQGSAAAGSSYG
jgi:hypothetical protein